MFVSEVVNKKVATALVQTLNVEEDILTPAATLEGDLGAASIDLLDIVFRLEREFDIDIPLGELFPDLIPLGDSEFARDGKVTDQGMDSYACGSVLPYADLAAFYRRLTSSSNVPDLFTVGLVAQYITWKLGQGDEPVPDRTEALPVIPEASTLQRRIATLACPPLP